MIESLNAITLNTSDMARALRFYISLGFEHAYGGPDGDFASFRVGPGHLNLNLAPGYVTSGHWGRVIFYVGDVDAMFQRAVSQGLAPSTEPRDAEWGERYFHIEDPDGHELSFARPLAKQDQTGRSQTEQLAARAAELYKGAKPKLDDFIERARPRAQQAGQEAMRFAREHEEELKQAANVIARSQVRGPLRYAAGAFSAPSASGRKPTGQVCAGCQTENTPSARFCSECGQALSSTAQEPQTNNNDTPSTCD